MSKKVKVTLDVPFEGMGEIKEYEGDVDAQLHNNGCLVILEYSPNIKAADGSKKAELIAIFSADSWDYVETE